MATVTDEIIDLHDRILGKLFNAAKHKHQQQFQASGKAINAKVRLATSIKQGTVTASLMLRKLGSYPRQNGLAVALRSWAASSERCSSWTGCKASSCAAACMPD
jgi:hypothetical protein